MDWSAWQPFYEEILADFGWTKDGDEQAAKTLQASLKGRSAWRDVGTELKHRPNAVVVGCGPALDNLRAQDIPPGIVVAADGATSRLRELGITPRVVVSDLDGKWDDLVWAGQQGSSFVIHGHGDNIDKLAAISELGPFVAGTIQCEPTKELEPLRNIGGFTDGDRAVLLCEHYQVRQVSLIAFDTGAQPSRYSHEWDTTTKPRKLAWCRRIIDGAKARGVSISGRY